MVLLRLAAVAGIRLYRYFDSAEYDILDFTGAARRPWTTPLLYRLVPGEETSLVVAQALIGAVAFTALAVSASTWFRDRRVAMVAALAVAVIGLVRPVTNWDTTKLSESLAISLTILLVAAWVLLARRPHVATAVTVLVVAVPWVFVRQSLMPMAWLIAVLTIVAAVVAWRRAGAWKVMAGLAVGLVAVAGLATAYYGQNREIVNHNLTVIVADRMAPHPERLDFFMARGMPIPESGDMGFASLGEDQEFQAWIEERGQEVYAEFLLTNPWYTLTEPIDDALVAHPSWLDEERQHPAMLSPPDPYGSSRSVLPEPVERVIYEPGATGTMLFALLAVGVWSIARWRDADRRWAVSLGTMVLALASIWTGWHGAVTELPRLALVGAVTLRVGLVMQLAILAETELRRRAR